MWCIRSYKDYNTNKYKGFRILNENTMEYKEFSTKEIKMILNYDPNGIYNLELDNYGNPRLKNINPEQKMKAYKQTYKNNLQINHYCIILGYSQGTLDFIADGIDGNIIHGMHNTLGEIAATLNIEDISKLKIANAMIRIENSKHCIYVFKDNNYRKLGDITSDSIYDIFESDWIVEIENVTQEGLRLYSIQHRVGVGKTSIPVGVCHIERFDGGVNNLILPISIHTLGKKCFSELEDLTKLKFGNGLAIIPEGCCRDSSLREVVFSGYETEISDYAFDSCPKLQGPITTNAMKIGECAFCDTNISTVNLLKATEIGVQAFAYCSRLSKVKLYDGLTEIKGGAFRHCKELQEVTIPSTVNTIGKFAFDGCKKLKKVRIAHGTKIGQGAFPKQTKIIYY